MICMSTSVSCSLSVLRSVIMHSLWV